MQMCVHVYAWIAYVHRGILYTHITYNALETKYRMTNNGYGREQLSVLYNLNLSFFV